MSQHESVLKHLLDIEQVIAELEEFGRHKTLDDLLVDRALQRVFEREFEILGGSDESTLARRPHFGIHHHECPPDHRIA